MVVHDKRTPAAITRRNPKCHEVAIGGLDEALKLVLGILVGSTGVKKVLDDGHSAELKAARTD